MSYNKTVWHTGDVVHADLLNNIEEGINRVDNKLEGIEEGALVNKIEGIQFNGSDLNPDSETKKVNILAAPYNQAVPLPQLNDEGKILGYEAPTEGARPIVGWVEKPSNGVTPHIDQTTKRWMIGEEDTNVDAEGKSAYQVYVASVPQGETPMTESQWLASLKGERGDDAVNPFKGIYGSDNKPTGTFASGDYIYAPTSVSGETGNTIWKWDGTTWQDSGETPDIANAEIFASSEILQQVAIDNSHLVNPVNTADTTKPVLAQAGDVMQLKAKLKGVTASEVAASYTIVDDYYINYDGSLREYSSGHYTVIPINGATKVRFLGYEIGSQSGNNYSYAFWNNPTYVDSSTVVSSSYYDVMSGETTMPKEYVVDVPEGATYIAITVASTNVPNFYCYLQSGDNVFDNFNKTVRIEKQNFSKEERTQARNNIGLGNIEEGSFEATDNEIVIETDEDTYIASIDEEGVYAKDLFLQTDKNGASKISVREALQSEIPTIIESETEEIVIADNSNVQIAKIDTNGIEAKEFFSDGFKITDKLYVGMAAIFEDWGFIGDSLTSGYMALQDVGGESPMKNQAYGSKGRNVYRMSWGQILARMYGATGTNFSVGGMTAKNWLATYPNQISTDGYDGKTGQFSVDFSNDPKAVYTICLGTNDQAHAAQNPVGNVNTDIDLNDYNNNADTFAGNYAKIIQMCKELVPSCKIFVITPFKFWSAGAESNGYNDVVRAMPTLFDKVYLIDLYNDGIKSSSKYGYGGHGTTLGYVYTAYLISKLIDKIVNENYTDFRFQDVVLRAKQDNGQY